MPEQRQKKQLVKVSDNGNVAHVTDIPAIGTTPSIDSALALFAQPMENGTEESQAAEPATESEGAPKEEETSLTAAAPSTAKEETTSEEVCFWTRVSALKKCVSATKS